MRVRFRWLIGALLILGVTVAAATWWATLAPAPVPFDRAVAGVLSSSGLVEPFGVAVAPDGTIYVSDAGQAHRIRRVGLDGRVATLAGTSRGFLDGDAERARFATPSGLALARDGALYVADTGNHAIRRLARDGQVTTIAGTGVPGFADGAGTSAQFDGPVGVAIDAQGRVVVADTYNDRIRLIESDGSVRTLAGGDGPGLIDGPAADARFDTPCGVAVDADGRIIVADTGNGVVRVIEPDGMVSTRQTAGVGLERPIAIAIEPTGTLVVVDESGVVVRISVNGEAAVLAGGAPGFADGEGEDARFRRPSGVAATTRASGSDDAGTPLLLVADAGNAMLRTLRPAASPRPAWTPGRALALLASPTIAAPDSPRPTPSFDADAFGRQALLWPVAPMEGPHEVAGTFAEARGEQGQERFHAGLDVREAMGTPVRAVRDGIVSSPLAINAFDTINESLRIGDLAYIHIRAGRDARGFTAWRAGRGAPSVPSTEGIDVTRFKPVFDDTGTLTRIRARRGAHFATGDVVGTINRFNHVHLNVGWPGEEHNPLRFRLVQFTDRIAPTIAAHGVRLFDDTGVPLNPDRPGPLRGRGRRRRPTVLPPLSPAVVRGRVRIVVDAWDQADGNASYRRLGLYTLGYEVFDPAGRQVEATWVDENGAAPAAASLPTLVFDRMPRERDAAKLVFASGSGIPVYGANRTQFLYVVTTRYRDGRARPGWWDTTRLAPGGYVLRVFGEDFSGNRVTRDLDVVVTP